MTTTDPTTPTTAPEPLALTLLRTAIANHPNITPANADEVIDQCAADMATDPAAWRTHLHDLLDATWLTMSALTAAGRTMEHAYATALRHGAEAGIEVIGEELADVGRLDAVCERVDQTPLIEPAPTTTPTATSTSPLERAARLLAAKPPATHRYPNRAQCSLCGASTRYPFGSDADWSIRLDDPGWHYQDTCPWAIARHAIDAEGSAA